MLVYLIGERKIYKIVLPNTVNGNYWITNEEDRKLLRIDGDGKEWRIESNNNVRIISPQYVTITNNKVNIQESHENTIAGTNIKEYDMHVIFIHNLNKTFILYCSPTYEQDFMHLDIKHGREITIGSGEKNSISYDNPLVSEVHAKISYNNGRWIVENYDKKHGTFVNNAPVYKRTRVLLNGDVIFIMGLKIIIMGKSIFINNPLERVKYNEKIFELNQFDFDVPNIEEDEDDTEISIENEYYSRSPRIRNKIEHEQVKIDPPPALENKEQMPTLLVLGSSLSMGVVMIVSMMSSVNGISNGKITTETIIQIITAFVMLLGILLFPILERKWEARQKVKYEQKRQERYRKYIDSKIEEIDKIANKQRNILFDNYSSVEECSSIILSKNPRLWERKTEDFDFLTVRLGIGDTPLDIDIQYPEKQFTMEDDDLVETLNTVANKSKTLKKVPITLSLAEKRIIGLISKDEEEQKRYMKNLIMQLITFQNYEDLKLVFLLKTDPNNKWEHFKLLPHVWNNTKDIRFFTDDYDEMKEISQYLEEDLYNRSQYQEEVDYKSFKPYYLIITDDYKKIESLKIITQILKSKTNVGFGLFCMSNDLTQLPNECRTFIDIDNGHGNVFESEMTSKGKREFVFDNHERLFWSKISEALSNIPIRLSASKEMSLPNTYTFLEMYDVGTIEQLNILDRWRKNDSTRSLKAPIGIDSTGMPIALDIHEKFHGPHGLIAGTTGSGKSEFIITYILSLAINYHPDDVTFILIDYKGGGLAGAFSKRGIKLPHLVGTITNIDKNGLQRSLASIQSELRRRQIMFNEARNMTDEGTIDIYKYQKLYHDGVVNKPISHLFIICDEFAELKQQQEDFMDELISVARIGRSLGVHLILATQKPAGVVNDQIRSNAKFAICLKVQEPEDSYDLIKRPDAAKLKNAGRFYLQVGNDEYFVLGQSAWSGAPYFPSDVAKKKVDNSIEFISDIGAVIKQIDNSKQKMESAQGEQLTNIVTYLHNLAEDQNIHEEPLWLEDIPETIFVKETREKYNIEPKENDITAIIGEYDDPNNQKQGPVELKLSTNGNTVIYGNAESGKETLLSTVVYDTMTTYTTDEIQMYILDFGSEALKIFKKSPHVGDVLFTEDDEKTKRFFDMLQKEIKTRKEILSEFGGDYGLYLKTSGNTMPMMLVVINSYEAFSENYEDKYEDILLSVTREGVKCGIVFITTVSTPNDMRYRLNQNFKQKIALQLNNEDDYYNIFDKVGKKRPSHMFGRGLVELDDGQIYEFQTAKICEAEKWNAFVKEEIEKLNKSGQEHAKTIPVLPDKVGFEDVKEYLQDLTNIPLGVEKNDLEAYTYDFKKKFINVISSKNIEDAVNFTSHIIEEIKQLEDVEITVLDAERILQTRKSDLLNNQNDFITKLEDSPNDNSRTEICVIIGIDKYINELEEAESEFLEILEKAENSGNYNFIIVDNVNRIKNHEYDDWYKNYILTDTGIWVGNGIEDQYLFSVNINGAGVVNNCGPSFGYAINQEIPTMIKLLGIKEKGD